MKKNVAVYLHSFLVALVLFSCGGIKTKFSEEELRWFNVYNEGDVLIFKSEKNELDTTIIIKKELYYPEYNPITVHDKYLPQWAKVWYKNKNLKNHLEGHTLITMIKRHPTKQTRLFLDYLYGDASFLNFHVDSIKEFKHDKVYKINTFHPKADPDNPKTIFWHEDYGVIKYITHSGIIWVRMNLSK